jgi:hypothetical protein
VKSAVGRNHQRVARESQLQATAIMGRAPESERRIERAFRLFRPERHRCLPRCGPAIGGQDLARLGRDGPPSPPRSQFACAR